jgi:hypothetical protein
MEDLCVVRQDEQARGQADGFAFEMERAAFSVPRFIALTESLVDRLAQVEQASDVQGNVAAHDLCFGRQRQHIVESTQWRTARTYGTHEKRRDLQWPTRVERDHLFAHRDLVSDEACKRGSVENAARTAEQRHEVHVAEVLAAKAEVLAKPHGEQGPSQTVLERLPGREISCKAQRRDDLCEPHASLHVS